MQHCILVIRNIEMMRKEVIEEEKSTILHEKHENEERTQKFHINKESKETGTYEFIEKR